MPENFGAGVNIILVLAAIGAFSVVAAIGTAIWFYFYVWRNIG